MDYSQDNFFQINKNLFQTGLTNLLKNEFKKPESDEDFKKLDVTATEFNNNLDQINYTLEQIQSNILNPIKPVKLKEPKEPKEPKPKKLTKKERLKAEAEAKAKAEAEAEGAEESKADELPVEGGVVVKIPDFRGDSIFDAQGDIMSYVEQIENKGEAVRLLMSVIDSFFFVKPVNAVFNNKTFKEEEKTQFLVDVKGFNLFSKVEGEKEIALQQVKDTLRIQIEGLFEQARAIYGEFLEQQKLNKEREELKRQEEKKFKQIFPKLEQIQVIRRKARPDLTNQLFKYFGEIETLIKKEYGDYIRELDSLNIGDTLPTKPDYLNVIRSVDDSIYRELIGSLPIFEEEEELLIEDKKRLLKNGAYSNFNDLQVALRAFYEKKIMGLDEDEQTVLGTKFDEISKSFTKSYELYDRELDALKEGDKFPIKPNYYAIFKSIDPKLSEEFITFNIEEGTYDDDLPEDIDDELPSLDPPPEFIDDAILEDIIEIAEVVDLKLRDVADNIADIVELGKSSSLNLTPIFNKVSDLIANLIKFIGITNVLYKGRIKKNLNYLEEQDIIDIKTKIKLFEENLKVIKLYIPLFNAPSEQKYKSILLQLIQIGGQLFNTVNNSIGQYNPKKFNKRGGSMCGGQYGFYIESPPASKEFNESPYKRLF